MKIKLLEQEQTWDSQVSVGYRRFQIGFVFVEYDLFLTTTFIQNCIYVYEFSYKGMESLSQTQIF